MAMYVYPSPGQGFVLTVYRLGLDYKEKDKLGIFFYENVFLFPLGVWSAGTWDTLIYSSQGV